MSDLLDLWHSNCSHCSVLKPSFFFYFSIAEILSLHWIDIEILTSLALLDLQILTSFMLLDLGILTSLMLLSRKILTSLSLLDLEGEVQGSDGEVDGLGVHPAHLTQQVHDEAPLTPHQTGQQLRDPETAVSCIHFPSILSHKDLF